MSGDPATGKDRSRRAWTPVERVTAVIAVLGLLLGAGLLKEWIEGLVERKPYNVLLALDLSGSMNCPIKSNPECPPLPKRLPPPRDRRIGATVRGATAAIPSLVQVGDRLGVVSFPPKPADPKIIREITSPETVALQEFKEGLRPLVNQAGGGTPLYPTIREGVRTLRASWQEDALNVMVVLTDGVNNGSKPKRAPSNEELEEKLNRDLGRDKGRPVRVLLTATYGSRCKRLLDDVTAFEHECFPVPDNVAVQAAYTEIEKRLENLARTGLRKLVDKVGARSPP